MDWNVKFTKSARKQLIKLDRAIQSAILDHLEDRVAKEPRRHGKALAGDKKGFWRYRVRDYRVICQLIDREIIVLVLAVGHRKDVYER
ncbi:MAG: type II toxin-antitoxin system RelE/ParE family toxin [Nitrospinae bacterium]|nr:type II toxin-antitoxin system RelE/ParE family toxin [Nitrospinota bacterium]